LAAPEDSKEIALLRTSCLFVHFVDCADQCLRLIKLDLNALVASSGNIDATTGQVLSAGSFGRIISTSNNPKIIQFALKFNF
jgi:hypothetical protein